ncbi:MAG: DUF1579 family protein [Candidatus Zixiibacteriota bacterium]
MKTLKLILAIIALCLTMATLAPAQDKKETAVPEMGAPNEIKDLAWLVGTWDVVMKSKWDPTATEWTEEKGTATYSYVADSAALMMNYESTAMGMPFKGFMLQTYDRETKLWQSAWADNLGARISLLTGTKANGKTVLTGEDMMQGQKMTTRMTTFNETPTKFEWSMESSADGGKTFMTATTAVYTKRK